MPDAFDELQAALVAEHWERALPTAIEAWRQTRAVELADLVDRITARCQLPKPPHTRAATHRWWMAHALDPDPVMIGGLLEAFPIRMHAETDVSWEQIVARWPPSNPVMAAVQAAPPPQWMVAYASRHNQTVAWPQHVQSWVDRLAAIIQWPDDPRIVRVLVDLMGNPDITLYAESNERLAAVLADRLIALGDRRALAWFEKQQAHNKSTTYKQRMVAPAIRRVIAAIAEPAPQERARIEASVARLPPSAPPRADLDELWQMVGEHLDDDAPRLVLADALIAAGDNRGELIALQCVTDPARRKHAETQAHRLLRKEWHRWLGDLAVLLTHRGTEMRRGMLEKIRVGTNATPPWAWESIRGHRELCAVQEVRPAMAPPHSFATLVAGLAHFPRMLQIDAHEVIEKLLETHSNTALREVHLTWTNSHVSYRRTRPSYFEIYRMLAQLAPGLERLDLGSMWWHGGPFAQPLMEPTEFVERLRVIKSYFPKLRAVRIEQSSVRDEVRGLLQREPLVEMVAGDLGP